MNYEEALSKIKRHKIKNWFDLGVFLDKLEKKRYIFSEKAKVFKSFSSFKLYIGNGSVAFLTYGLGVDGISVEIGKYIKAFRQIFGKEFDACFIAGNVDNEAAVVKREAGKVPVYTIPEAVGFEKWGEPYHLLFFQNLKQGGEFYNLLPAFIWNQSTIILEKLLNIIQKQNVRCLFLNNIASNPGNLSFTVATILASEILGLPVININYDFYWEEGKNPQDRRPEEQPGARDHFFTNANVGEIFGVIKQLFPWRGSGWIHVNINKLQTQKLISEEGINPSRVTEIGTAIDADAYANSSALRREKTFYKLALIFSTLRKDFSVISPNKKTISRLAKEGKPFIIGEGKLLLDPNKTLLFLQPTRVTERKKIERNFTAIEELLKNNEFAEHLQKEQKNIFLLITGPISGPFKYFLKLKRRISSFYENLPDKWKKRVYIGFKFGKDSGENLVRKDLEKISMTELYQASDLVFLLSSTEGRGLPIIESAAAGVPLLVTKFEPKQTFEEVSEDLWAFVWEYKKKKQVIQAVVPYILDSDARIRLASKNQAVVKKRFSYKVLEDQLLYILKKSWRHTNHEAEAKRLAHQEISTLLKQRKNSLKDLVYDKNRTYIPGYNPLGFMFCIKSLNEPSFFRQEYLDLRSRLFCFGNTFVDRVKVNPKKRYLFYKALETMLTLTRGKEKIIVDHSFTFRFRTDKHFLYYQLTEQELKGAIVLLARNVFGKDFDSFKLSGSKRRQIDTSLEKLKALSEQNNEWEDIVKRFFPEVKSASLRLLRRELYNKPRPIIFFLGPLDRVPLYLKVFVEVVLSHWLAKDKKATSQLRIYLVVNKNPFFNSTTVQDVNEILERKEFRFFKKYVKTGIVSILSESTHTQGFNCYGASSRLKKIVSKIKTDKGLALSSGEDMFVTLDLLDLPSFRFGTAETAMFCRYTGLPQGKSFIQYMPAGIRPVLNYPYPTQQVTEFESFVCKHADKSESFWEKVKIRQDETGESLNSSINFILNNNSYEKKSSILCGKIAGKYESGMPWTAAYFKVNYPTLREQHDELQFHLLESDKKKKQSILELICQFERENKKKVVCGMNGGFILNNELVGKLGLSSDFLGVPLGLTITQGKVKSLPLFNRPALIFTSKGKVFTDRISLPPGKMWVTSSPKQSLLVWSEKQINSTNLKISEEVVVYTLQHDAKVSTKNRVLVVICGNKVASIYIPRFRSMSKEYKSLLPVGITFSFPKKLFEKKYSQYYKVGQTVGFELELEKKWGSIEEAIEAGPLLIKEGQIAIDMEIEGWKTKHSLKTQANRLDKLNLQGPKIGLGMTKTGDIIGVSVEGRIRESVGATYPQLAEILLSMGAWEGLAFDPGGSASLYANGNLLNLSPYDPNFDRLVYFGSSQPRGIGNAFILSRNKK